MLKLNFLKLGVHMRLEDVTVSPQHFLKISQHPCEFMVAPGGIMVYSLGTMVLGPENMAKMQQYVNRHSLHWQGSWGILKMGEEKQVYERNNNGSTVSPPPEGPPWLPRLGHVSLICTPMAPIATQHLLQLIEMICLYVQRLKHIPCLLGMYPIGSCIPWAQQAQKMTVFVTITVIILVSSTNAVFIEFRGFVAASLLWWRHGRWLLGVPSRRHKPQHEK